jgi:hypothetical protein
LLYKFRSSVLEFGEYKKVQLIKIVTMIDFILPGKLLLVSRSSANKIIEIVISAIKITDAAPMARGGGMRPVA